MISRPDLTHVGGFLIAVIGFAITRFVVAGTIDGPAGVPFVIAVVSLTAGLVFTVYGVVLAVGDFPRSYVVTVVRWTVLGVSLMVGVLTLTVLGMAGSGEITLPGGSRLLVANALLGGAIGGALTGDRAGINRRQRDEIELQAELGRVVNELLRHEVLNATAVIDGYASLFDSEVPRDSDVEAIRGATDRIEATVSDIGAVGRARDVDHSVAAVDLIGVLRDEIEAFRERYPDAEVSVTLPDGEVGVVAGDRLRLLVGSFLATVTARSESPTVDIGVSADRHRAELWASSTAVGTASGEGNGDPATGFDRRIVELLADHYEGELLADPEAGTLTLGLPRATADRPDGGQFGVTSAGAGGAVATGLVAGVLMGVLSQHLVGLLPVIGSLYGAFDPVVGWVTHLFHSVVFAVIFAGGYAYLAPRSGGVSDAVSGALGLAWGLFLWFVAAGFVMPLWLRLTGVEAAVPNLTAIGLFTHAVWGLAVGVLYPRLGDRFASNARLERLRAIVGRRFDGALG